MVLRRAWDQLRPGGRLVIMDAKVPSGPAEKIVSPFSLWLMKHTMLGNPLIKPWKVGRDRGRRSHGWVPIQIILYLSRDEVVLRARWMSTIVTNGARAFQNI